MASLLGSLLIELGINTGSFVEGMDKASLVAKRKAKEIGEGINEIGHSISETVSEFGQFGGAIGAALSQVTSGVAQAIRSTKSVSESGELSIATIAGIGGAAIAAVAGIGEMTIGMMELAQQIENTSAMTGLSVRDTQIWGRAAEESGVSAEAMAMGLGRVQMQLGRYIESGGRAGSNSGAFVRVMNDLGIAIKNTDGSLRPLSDVLLDFADKLNGLDDAEQRVALGQAAMGRGGRQFLEMVNTSRLEGKSLRDTFEEIGQSSIVFSDQQVEGAMKAKAGWDELTRAVGGAYNQTKAFIQAQVTAETPGLAQMSQMDKPKSETSGMDVAAGWIQKNRTQEFLKQNQALLAQDAVVMAGSAAKAKLVELEREHSDLIRGEGGQHGAAALEIAKQIVGLKEVIRLEDAQQKAVKAPLDEVAKHVAMIEAEVAAHQKFLGVLGSTSAAIEKTRAVEAADNQMAALRTTLLAKEAEEEETLANAKGKSGTAAAVSAAQAQRELDATRKQLVELDAAKDKWEGLEVTKANIGANDTLYTRIVEETEKTKQQTDAVIALTQARTADAVISAKVAAEMAGEKSKAAAGGSRSDVGGALGDKEAAIRALIASQQSEISVREGESSAANVAGIRLETAAVMEGANARRSAAAAATALRYAQEHPEATADQLRQEAADVRAVSDAEHQKAIAQKASSLDATRGYRDEMVLLEEVRTEYGNIRDVVIAVDAAEKAALDKMRQELDKAAESSGTLGEGFKGLLDQIIQMGSHTQAGFFSTMTEGVNEFEGALAKFIVTGQGGFKKVLESMIESLVKLGLQFIVAAALKKFFNQDDQQSKNIIQSQVARQSAIGQAAAEAATQAAWAGPGAAIAAAAITEASLQGITALETGGDVSPGRAYVVGEKRPELFIPSMSGHVYPSLGAGPSGGGGGAGDTHINITHMVSTLDADSFRDFARENSAIIAEELESHIRRRNGS